MGGRKGGRERGGREGGREGGRGEGEMLEALRVLFGLYPHKRGALNQV